MARKLACQNSTSRGSQSGHNPLPPVPQIEFFCLSLVILTFVSAVVPLFLIAAQ